MSSAADNTAQKQQIGRPFEPGQSGNPSGRPKGSRNKFSEKLLEAFAKDFDQYGEEVIQTVRTERPHEYLRIAASLMPKQMEIEDKRGQGRAEDLSDDELAAIAAGQSNGADDHLFGNG
jgi:hypothetical protein